MTSTATSPRARPLADPLFRRLWAGESLAGLSEQLFIVCLTLLVLDIAGPGGALGLVLAVAAVPRALLMPFGGLLADRVAPARIVVVTTWLRAALLALLAVLVATGPPSIAVIAVLAGALGALDAAYYPASLSLLPQVVAPDGLPAANAPVQGAESAGDLLGPALATAAVAAAGLAGAFGAVTALYLVAAALLATFARRLARTRPAISATTEPGGAVRDLREGLAFAWREPVVRTTLIVLVILNVALVGPALVGGAVLAEQRLGGAERLGLVFVGFGVGSLIGLSLAGGRPPRRRGPVLIAGLALLGAGTAALGLAQSLTAAALIAGGMGLGGGYLGVVLTAWLQERVPARLRGRVMSLVALSAVALDPLSLRAGRRPHPARPRRPVRDLRRNDPRRRRRRAGQQDDPPAALSATDVPCIRP